MITASVIVVEDERIVALHLKQQLTRLGYEVPAMATSGEQALKHINEKRPDVVLMDINIEGPMDGIMTAAKIPQELQIPVIYLTAYSEEVTLERARNTKPYGYLIKPFAERELHATIQMVLERRRVDIMVRDNEKRLDQLVADRTSQLHDQMSQRSRLERELYQMQKLESLGHLTGGIAHDFNNLLTVIIGSLTKIKCRPNLTNDEIHRCVDMALQAGNNAATLTQRLLAFARRQPLDPKPHDLNQLVSVMTEMLRRMLGESLDLALVLDPALHTACLDSNQLESALLNVAINGRDAMSASGTLTIRTANAVLDEAFCARRSATVPGEYVMLEVSDTGVGMTEEVVSKCFEPFFTTKDDQGTGLGLAQVYGFVTQSGGHVTIDSELGKGTTLRMYFPIFDGSAIATEQSHDIGEIPPSTGNEFVLVVEDNHDVRAYVVDTLRELGYLVTHAPDAATALELLSSRNDIQLLFTDIGLPGGQNGRQLAETARGMRPDLPVLFTSAYPYKAVASLGRIDAGIDLLGKPFTPAMLAKKVRHALDSKDSQAARCAID